MPIHTINQHYTAIIRKNLEAICDKYEPSEATYVVLEGPRLTTRGYEKIKKGWTDFCASGLRLLSIDWTEGPFEETSAAMAWVAGIVELKVEVNGRAFSNTFRTSFVLVNSNDEWKIKHEHVSIVHPDPYGIGDWLQKPTDQENR